MPAAAFDGTLALCCLPAPRAACSPSRRPPGPSPAPRTSHMTAQGWPGLAPLRWASPVPGLPLPPASASTLPRACPCSTPCLPVLCFASSTHPGGPSRGPARSPATATSAAPPIAPAAPPPPPPPLAQRPPAQTAYTARASLADWSQLYAHLSFAATPRVEAADALAHNKWEAGPNTLSQQQLWRRIQEDAREVASSGARGRGQ